MATTSGELTLFDTREAAAVWGVTLRTAERWAKSGRAKPAKEVRGCYVFTGEEVKRVARLGMPRRGPARGTPRPHRPRVPVTGRRPQPYPPPIAGVDDVPLPYAGPVVDELATEAAAG